MHASSTRSTRSSRPRRQMEPETCRTAPHLPKRINGIAYELALVLVAGEWAITWVRSDETPQRPPRCARR